VFYNLIIANDCSNVNKKIENLFGFFENRKHLFSFLNYDILKEIRYKYQKEREAKEEGG
jgi:hypothetical protein